MNAALASGASASPRSSAAGVTQWVIPSSASYSGRDEARQTAAQHEAVHERGVRVALGDDPGAERRERQAQRVVALRRAVGEEERPRGAERLRREPLRALVRRRRRPEVDPVDVLRHVGGERVDADRLAQARIGARPALVARHVEAGRAAEGIGDDRVEVGRGGLLVDLHRGLILRRSLLRMDAEILAAVAAEHPAMVGLLAELVAERTVLGREASGQAVMRRAFAGLGLEPFDVPLDAAALERHPGGAPFSWALDGKANVLADWGNGDGRSLILNGHIDVVSPEPSSLWNGDPFTARVDGDWMYGRGAGDMKAGLAAIVGAVAGLKRLGAVPHGRVQLQSVVEEECTGHGALACVLAGHTADAAILTEPTSEAIWNAQVGVLWFQVRVLGRPAHAGDAVDGANAIEASYAVIEALRGLEAELNTVKPPLFAAYPHPINLNVGMIQGGDWPSTVAGECRTSFRLALYPGEPVGGLKARVEQAVASVAAGSDFHFDVVYDGFQCEGYELAPDAPLVTGLADAVARATGAAPALYASTATTDARSFHLYGDTPAVCFGPHAENEHGVDERVHLPSMTRTAQAIALFIADWCGLKNA